MKCSILFSVALLACAMIASPVQAQIDSALDLPFLMAQHRLSDSRRPNLYFAWQRFYRESAADIATQQGPIHTAASIEPGVDILSFGVRQRIRLRSRFAFTVQVLADLRTARSAAAASGLLWVRMFYLPDTHKPHQLWFGAKVPLWNAVEGQVDLEVGGALGKTFKQTRLRASISGRYRFPQPGSLPGARIRPGNELHYLILLEQQLAGKMQGSLLLVGFLAGRFEEHFGGPVSGRLVYRGPYRHAAGLALGAALRLSILYDYLNRNTWPGLFLALDF